MVSNENFKISNKIFSKTSLKTITDSFGYKIKIFVNKSINENAFGPLIISSTINENNFNKSFE